MAAWTYYNEIDPYPAQWLRNLIAAGELPEGEVDERSIADVHPEDLDGFGACHFFAGIGGWPLALKLAGWPDEREVWTGSCPCQPFSAAGQRRGRDDDRHLWPEFRRLIAERRPATVFGEQVVSPLGREWLAGVRSDLEALGYACGAADLPAACVGAPHIRQRLWWVAESDRVGPDGQGLCLQAGEGTPERHCPAPSGRGATGDGAGSEDTGADGRLADPDGRHASAEGLQRGGQYGRQPQDGELGERVEHAAGDGRLEGRAKPERRGAAARREPSRMGYAGGAGPQERERDTGVQREPGRASAGQAAELRGDVGFWSDSALIRCADGKARRIGVDFFALADGFPGFLATMCADNYAEAIKAVRHYGQATTSRSSEVLHSVREAILSGSPPDWSVGKQAGVCAAEILLAFLRELETRCEASNENAPSSQASESEMRSLRQYEETACASHRRKSRQLDRWEYPDALHVLSRVLAQDAYSAWTAHREQNAAPIAPLSVGEAGRVGRLRAYGNAITPQCAQVFIEAFLKCRP